jgi:hypothetical protein
MDSGTSELARLHGEHEQLRADNERLKTELVMAQQWVRMLAEELDAVDASEAAVVQLHARGRRSG